MLGSLSVLPVKSRNIALRDVSSVRVRFIVRSCTSDAQEQLFPVERATYIFMSSLSGPSFIATPDNVASGLLRPSIPKIMTPSPSHHRDVYRTGPPVAGVCSFLLLLFCCSILSLVLLYVHRERTDY